MNLQLLLDDNSQYNIESIIIILKVLNKYTIIRILRQLQQNDRKQLSTKERFALCPVTFMLQAISEKCSESAQIALNITMSKVSHICFSSVSKFHT